MMTPGSIAMRFYLTGIIRHTLGKHPKDCRDDRIGFEGISVVRREGCGGPNVGILEIRGFVRVL